MSQYTVNLHITRQRCQMSVYHLCYCLQSLLLLLRIKLVLQQSKNVTAKCTETQSPTPSIQFFLVKRVFKENDHSEVHIISFNFIQSGYYIFYYCNIFTRTRLARLSRSPPTTDQTTKICMSSTRSSSSSQSSSRFKRNISRYQKIV